MRQVRKKQGVAQGVYIQCESFWHFRRLKSEHGSDHLLYYVCHITHFYIIHPRSCYIFNSLKMLPTYY